MTPKVVIVARSAGAANALGPVACALIAQAEMRVSVVGYTHAETIFRRYRLSLLEETNGFESPARLLDREQPSVLLTGTSNEVMQDAALWQAARTRAIPSLAILDHWCNYAERFTGEDGIQYGCMPDRVAVMDETAYRAMVETGCPPGRLIVTGHPGFDALMEPADVPLRASARADLGIDVGTKLIVFASEPHAEPDGSVTRFVGYTEADVLQLLLETLDRLGRSCPLTTIVKPHPIEHPDLLKALIRSRKRDDVRVLQDVPPRHLMAASDVVTGMTSIFLLEAALMGRPTISLQPHRLFPDGFVDHLRPLLDLAVTADECRRLLVAALAESETDWERRRQRAMAHGFDGRASQRIVALLKTLLNGTEQQRAGRYGE